VKLLELIEARKNPTLNVKNEGHEGALRFLDKFNGDETVLYNIGISMTEVPKLGINPQSEYNTPIGIYFYPAEYYKDIKSEEDKLPFVDDAKYIQIFKINKKILDINSVDYGTLDEEFHKLLALVPQLSTEYNIDRNELNKELGFLMAESLNKALVNSYGGYLWYILWKFSGILKKSKKKTNKDSNPLVWNRLFRLLGYSAVIDNGRGIIHKNEKYQGVVVDPSSITHLTTIRNTSSEHLEGWAQIYATIVNAPSPEVCIKKFILSVGGYIETDTKSEKKVFNKIHSILTTDEEIFSNISEDQLQNLREIYKRFEWTGWDEVKKEHLLYEWHSQYSSMFQMLKHRLTKLYKTPDEEKDDFTKTHRNDHHMVYSLGNFLQDLQRENNKDLKQLEDGISNVLDAMNDIHKKFNLRYYKT